MNIIGWFSCGVTSAVACKLALEKYGIDNVDLYYIEIDTAHPDNERFISECEKWYGKTIKRVRNKKYKDQFEVIEHHHHINGPRGSDCTRFLKKDVRLKLQRELNNPTQVFGFEYSKKEINRAIRFVQQNENANAVFPLIEQQITKENALAILLSNGIEIPAMYRLGYKNNNCIGCVKGGKAYWNRIRIDFPDVFEKMATLERENGRSCINGQFLDELDPSAGRFDPPLLPDCGNFCEVKYTEIIDPLVDKIFKQPFRINEILNDLF